MKNVTEESMDIKQTLKTLSARGDDSSLHDSGHLRNYWYSISDGFRLLSFIRNKYLIYSTESGIPYVTKAGEERTATRENRHRILVTDPYYLDNFITSLDDDVKTITATHTTDEYGANQIAKNNLWSAMPNMIIIPLLSGAHWRSIRIQINYTNTTASILYDDPYGAKGISDILVGKIEPELKIAISKLFSQHVRRVVATDIEIHKKWIDQQGELKNGCDCGPITFSNIADYTNHNKTNENFVSVASSYTVSLATTAMHEDEIVGMRATDAATYEIESQTALPTSSILTIEEMKQLLRTTSEKKKECIQNAADSSTITKINFLSPGVCSSIFEIIDGERSLSGQDDLLASYSSEELNKAYDIVVNRQDVQRKLSGSFYHAVVDLDPKIINEMLNQSKSKFRELKFPIGSSDFKTMIRKNYVYVDKTELIKEIVESSDEVILITRPRRWGKTTNMLMLKYFFSLSVDEHGYPLDINPNKSLFDKLLIMMYPDIVSKHQGKYPVILISFRNVTSDNNKDIGNQLKSLIESLYENYQYLLHSTRLTKLDIKKFEKYTNGDLSEDEISYSLLFLSKLLYKHHAEKVYILIDEYDTPLNHVDQNPQALGLIRSILGQTLKDNVNLEKAVLTGITKIAKSGMFSDLNNVVDYSILDPEYAQHFGFTEAEVENLLDKALMKDELIRGAVKEWYNGYQIGSCLIYNPWSLANFFTRMRIQSYWVNTESMVVGDRRMSSDLLVSDDMQEEVRKLISNCEEGLSGTIEITINPHVTFNHLKTDPTATWTLLAFAGYLSVDNVHINTNTTLTCHVRIPNKELLGIYMSAVSFWIEEKLNIDLNQFYNLLKNFDLENIKQVQNSIKKVIAKYCVRVAQGNESIFHSLIEVSCLFGGKKHLLSAEKKSGTGRIDSIFYPLLGKSDRVIIHEYKILKTTSTEDNIQSKLQEAFWQVYERNYMEEVITKQLNFSYSHYRDIEIRAMVVLVDENNHNYGLRVDTMTHTISDSKKILDFFKKVTAEQMLDLKIRQVQEIITALVVGSEPLAVQLGAASHNLGATVFALGGALNRRKLARELIAKHGLSLFEMEQKELRKIKGIGDKRAEVIQECGRQIKKLKLQQQFSDSN